MVGVERLELPTSWSQTTRATNCATPRLTSLQRYFNIKNIICQGIFKSFLTFFIFLLLSVHPKLFYILYKHYIIIYKEKF